MESSVFNPRIFLGSVATAGVLVAGAAVPAFASGQLSHHHPLKPTGVVSATSPIQGVTAPVQGAVGGTPAGSALSSTPAGGLLGALAGLPIVGPLFSAFSDGISGGSAAENPVSGALHGLSTGTGLSSVASGLGGAVGGTIDSIAKAIPGGSKITSLLPGGSVTGTLNGITGGLSGITNAVPGIGSVTGALPKAGS
jgi:hypothetical protein